MIECLCCAVELASKPAVRFTVVTGGGSTCNFCLKVKERVRVTIGLRRRKSSKTSKQRKRLAASINEV
jgi:hypothetical protein